MTKPPPWTRCLLLVHTGTGNSLRAARWLGEELAAGGCAVSEHQARAGVLPPPAPGAEALLVLAFPVHGFTAPWAVLAGTAALPRGAGTPAVVLVARGGTRWGPLVAPGVEGSAGVLAAFLLLLRGYRVLGWRGIDMPANWTAVHPALGAESVRRVRARGRAQVADLAARLRAGRLPMGAGTALQTLLGIALAPVSLGYLLIGRQLLARVLVASPACDGCGVCRERCPHRAIAWWRGRPYWTLACESCMRCMAACPRRAVQASYPLAAALVVLAGLAAGAAGAGLAALVPALAPALDRDLPRMALLGALLAAVAVPAYLAAWLLARTPALGLLVHGLTPTRWYRRHRDPEVRAGELEGAPRRDG